MRSRFFVALLTLLCVSLAFVACKNEKEGDQGITTAEAADDDSPVDTTAGDATHPASPGGTAIVPSVSSGTTVVVMIEDGRVAVQQQTIPRGPAVFTVTNGGEQLHNLHIEGPGASVAAGDPIAAKASRDVSVMLQAGTYTLYCPVLDHRERGEQTTITIQP
ncbi:MAG TPA: hypothetical protein VGF48_09785 [Thermoanaerobaculia bacterium]|jgi:hypothetical protein